MSSVVAIHQPNFFPWLGYFDKIATADVFVLLDDVQFPKTGGTWCNRVKIGHDGQPVWLTAPVDRSYSGVRAINEMQYSTALDWRLSLRNKIAQAYARAPFYLETMHVLDPLLSQQANNVAEYNTRLVGTIAEHLGLCSSKIVLSSTLDVGAASTQRLVDICRALGGSTYLSGGGAQGYQDPAVFDAAGISLRFQNFVHPRYPQEGAAEFVPGLSIMDALMNRGREAVAAWLKNRGDQL